MGNNVLNSNYIDSFSLSVLSSVGRVAFLTLIMFFTKRPLLGDNLWRAYVVSARFFYLSWIFITNTL